MYPNGDTHAQRIMDNGVILILSQAFQDPWLWYYRMLEVKKREFGVVTYDIRFIPNLTRSLTVLILLINARRRLSWMKSIGHVMLGVIRLLMHIGIWLLASLTSHLANLSVRRCGITECKQSEGMSFEYLPMVWRPYQISLISVQPFCSYEVRTHVHHFWRGRFAQS
jgi:hypothetical protein